MMTTVRECPSIRENLPELIRAAMQATGLTWPGGMTGVEFNPDHCNTAGWPEEFKNKVAKDAQGKYYNDGQIIVWTTGPEKALEFLSATPPLAYALMDSTEGMSQRIKTIGKLSDNYEGRIGRIIALTECDRLMWTHEGNGVLTARSTHHKWTTVRRIGKVAVAQEGHPDDGNLVLMDWSQQAEALMAAAQASNAARIAVQEDVADQIRWGAPRANGPEEHMRAVATSLLHATRTDSIDWTSMEFPSGTLRTCKAGFANHTLEHVYNEERDLILTL